MELGGPASQASSPSVDSGPRGREDVPFVGRNVVVVVAAAAAVGESGPGAGGSRG